MGGRRHGQAENQAELSSPSPSAARSGSLQIGSAQQPRIASLTPCLPLRPSSNSSPGIVPNPGWPLTASSSCATGCTRNRAGCLPTPSTNNLRLWAARLRVEPTVVHIQHMTRKWGSCCSGGIVTFADDLAREESGFQDFVIAHELLHLRVKNHGRVLMRQFTYKDGESTNCLRRCVR